MCRALSTGAVVPSSLRGVNIREKVFEYHRQYPGNLAVGSMSYTSNSVGPVETMLVDVVKKSSTQEEEETVARTAGLAHLEELEHEVLELRMKAVQSRGYE